MDQVGFHVRPVLADAAISPVAFPAVYLGQIAVHAGEAEIQAVEQRGQVFAPGAYLDDVLGDEVVSGPGRDRAGEAPSSVGWQDASVPRERLHPGSALTAGARRILSVAPWPTRKALSGPGPDRGDHVICQGFAKPGADMPSLAVCGPLQARMNR